MGAREAGAHRLELCVDLDTGGLTPAPSLVEVVRSAVDIPVFAMARPYAGPFTVRAGDGSLDAGRLLDDVAMLRDAGADGIVMGALHDDGTVDADTTRVCVEAARGLPVTFHRAFDEVVDPIAALDVLVEVGVARVLTGGGRGAAREGADVLADLVRHAQGRIAILAGGKVRGEHVRHLAAYTGVREVHARAEGIAGIVRALG